MILAKNLGCQVLLPSPNNKLLENASFFTWHLVLRFGKTIDLSIEFQQTIGVEQLQQFAKSTWHPRIFVKTIKNSLQKVGKTTWQFCELGKISPSFGKYAKSSITCHYGIMCIPICQLVLPTCWRLNFVILVKILGCQVLLLSPNSKLLENASFFLLDIWF